MENQNPNRRIQAAQVRSLCGDVSDMWLWRRLNDDSGFPQPIYIARTRFWKEIEVIDWLNAQSVGASV